MGTNPWFPNTKCNKAASSNFFFKWANIYSYWPEETTVPKVHRCPWPACRTPKTANKFQEHIQFNLERLTQSKTTRTRLQTLLEKLRQTITCFQHAWVSGWMKQCMVFAIHTRTEVNQVVPLLVYCSLQEQERLQSGFANLFAMTSWQGSSEMSFFCGMMHF